MFTIIKGAKKIQIPSNEVASLQTNYEGVIVTCTDRTELRFSIETNNAIQAVLSIADKNLSKDITIDLNAAVQNKTSDILKIGAVQDVFKKSKNGNRHIVRGAAAVAK